MFANLLAGLRNAELQQQLGGDLDLMMQRAAAVVIAGGEFFWGKPVSQETRLALYSRAEQVADMHASLRNLLIVHAELPTSTDRAHFLGLVTLIREVERLVERGKDLVEISRITVYPLPDDDAVRELRQLRRSIESMLQEVPEVLTANDVRRAQHIDQLGHENIRRLVEVIARTAAGDARASHAVAIGLGSRIYSRVQRQLLNIVSSITTPLHLVNFFEEATPDRPPESVR